MVKYKKYCYLFSCLLFIFFVSGCGTADFRKSASINYDNAIAANFNAKLGLLYLKQGNFIRSKEKLLLALHQDPQNYLVYDSFAYFLEKTAEPRLAEQHYLKAIRVAGNNGEKGIALNNYGTYLYRQQRNADAIKYFLSATNDQFYLHVAKAYENAGFAALAGGDKVSAKKYFQLAVDHDPHLFKSIEQIKLLDKRRLIKTNGIYSAPISDRSKTSVMRQGLTKKRRKSGAYLLLCEYFEDVFSSKIAHK